MSNFKSNQVKMYPSFQRNPAQDLNAKLNSEENIINVNNTITDINSYYVSGNTSIVDLLSSSKISSGKVVIHGYLFNLSLGTSGEDLPTPGSSATYPQYVRLKIATSSTSASGITLNNIVGTDTDATSTSTYSGLTMELANQIEADTSNTFYLYFAKKTSGSASWQAMTDSKCKVNASSLSITNNYYASNVKTDLQTYLDNLVINDGEVT